MMKKAEILGKIELRQSTVKDFLMCPLMFKYRHIDKLKPSSRHSAALHGSALHAVIYLMHKESWYVDFEKIYEKAFHYYERDKPGESDIPVYWKGNRKHELELFTKNAVEILSGYQGSLENRESVVLFAECPFRVTIGGFQFTGTIDQVREHQDGTIELLDFKSSKQRPHPASLHNDWQLNLYTYALRFGEIEIEGRWVKPEILADYSSIYFLRAHEIRKRTTVNGRAGDEKGEPMLRTQKSLQDLRHFRKETVDLLKVMLKDWHFPNTNGCLICSYKDNCLSRHGSVSPTLADKAQRQLQELELVN
jgi:RecB family exonuclease